VSAPLSSVAIWSIAAVAVMGVITRPKKWPEAWWVVAGALALVVFALISPTNALAAVAKGTDVYLFLIGMMMLAELARREGLFDWLATYALQHARGCGKRLFLLIYGVGVLVTIFLSNDATAVVLTPAVYAVTKHARVAALPYLLICAFIANAASFALPISNPANLVVFGDHMPPLGVWLCEFGAASVVSIVLTYVLLRLTQRKHIPSDITTEVETPPLLAGGRIAAGAIAMTGIVLLAASLKGWQLGFPTCVAGVTAWLAISRMKRASPWPVLRKISWSVLPLVAGLFVLVRAVDDTGVLSSLIHEAAVEAQRAPAMTAFIGGSVIAFTSNLINNLPMGLIGATVVQGAHLSPHITGALLIGVDLGPNLSITGSLATILWLVAIRREGEDVSAGKFLAIGVLVMPLTLLVTLAIFSWPGTLHLHLQI
jgi:arsenical pump membrane protein